ncbi:MAG: NERD domain-containing protein [Clostridia bacterium]|nr:NERD domain-containing protein [Clostridia bacterium]
MTYNDRIQEIVSSMPSFQEEFILKKDLLPELLALQSEIIDITFAGSGINCNSYHIQEALMYLRERNNQCGNIIDEEITAFEKLGVKLGRLIGKEFSGNIGEQKAACALEIMRCKHRILRNIELSAPYSTSEIDYIVLTEKAIFLIEVKNSNQDIYISPCGSYYRSGTTKKFDKNIGESLNTKTFLLLQALKDLGVTSSNIVNLVVCTNCNIQIQNEYPYLDICYLSTLPHLIDNYEGETLYTQDDLLRMEEYIKLSSKNTAYRLDFNVAEFKTLFAVIISKLEGYTPEELPSELEFDEPSPLHEADKITTNSSDSDSRKTSIIEKVKHITKALCLAGALTSCIYLIKKASNTKWVIQ